MREILGWGAILKYFYLFDFEPYPMYSGMYKGVRLYVFGVMPDEMRTLLDASDEISTERKKELPFWRWYGMQGPGQPHGHATKLKKAEQDVNVRGQHMVGWRRVTANEPTVPRYKSLRAYIEGELDVELGKDDDSIMIHSRLISDLAYYNNQITAHFLNKYQGQREQLMPEW